MRIRTDPDVRRRSNISAGQQLVVGHARGGHVRLPQATPSHPAGTPLPPVVSSRTGPAVCTAPPRQVCDAAAPSVGRSTSSSGVHHVGEQTTVVGRNQATRRPTDTVAPGRTGHALRWPSYPPTTTHTRGVCGGWPSRSCTRRPRCAHLVVRLECTASSLACVGTGTAALVPTARSRPRILLARILSCPRGLLTSWWGALGLDMSARHCTAVALSTTNTEEKIGGVRVHHQQPSTPSDHRIEEHHPRGSLSIPMPQSRYFRSFWCVLARWKVKTPGVTATPELGKILKFKLQISGPDFDATCLGTPRSESDPKGGGCNRTAVPSLVYPSATRFILVSRSSPFYRARLFPLASSSLRRGSSSLSPSLFPTATACLGPHRHSSTNDVCVCCRPGQARPPRTRTHARTLGNARDHACARMLLIFVDQRRLCAAAAQPTLVVHTPFLVRPTKRVVLSYSWCERERDRPSSD